MREIKFRVWSEGRKKWLNECMFGMEVKGAYDFSSDASMRYNYKTNVIIEQFTGLTDKNGVEIYEGDIVKKDDDKFTKHGVVSFIHGCWMVASEDGERYFNLHWHLSQVEVIGNVHQNRELLEQNDE